MASTIVTERRLARAALLAVVLAVAPRPAFAEPTEQDKAVAQSLFDRARTLAEGGKFTDACPLFEESQRLDPAAGTALNLALCYEGEQRFAKAYGLLSEALSASIRDGRTDRRAIAEEHLASIGNRLSMLTVMVPDEARVPELILWLDGEKISSASAGVPIAVDGGKHKVEATARKHHPFSTDIDVKPDHDRVTVTVPTLAPYVDEAPVLPNASNTARVPMAPLARTRDREATPSPPKKERRAVAWGLGATGLGLVTLGIGTGIGALMKNAKAKDMALSEGCNFARSYCPQGVSPSAAISTSQTASALGWTSTLSLGVGAAAFIVALAIPKKVVESQAPVKPLVGGIPGGVGVGVRY